MTSNQTAKPGYMLSDGFSANTRSVIILILGLILMRLVQNYPSTLPLERRSKLPAPPEHTHHFPKPQSG